ncbi:MAG: 3'(2'),5'-bisphosphate nucleotidase CysQ [Pacificimonas sp.]
MRDDLALIVAAAREAGQLGLDMAKAGIDKWDKSPNNPVTAADIAIDKMLSARLRTARPAYGWLSEEREDDKARLDCDRTFLVDPIDGTRDYARGRPGWCVSVAVVEHGEPVCGVLHAPVTGALYTAIRGGGAYLDGVRISVSDRTTLTGARLPLDEDFLRSKYWCGPDCETVPKPNSIALRMAKVADGSADALFDGRQSRELDIAAAVLLVTEAGGIVTDTEGVVPTFNKPIPKERNLVASATPELHEAARAEMQATLERWRAAQARKPRE